MLTYEQLPDHARLWIYPASRELSTAEVERLSPKLASFANQWTAHRNELQAYAAIWSNRFLVFGVDEKAAVATGCSIDSSVRFVQQLASELDVDFFDRMLFFVKEGESYHAYPREQFEEAFSAGKLTEESIVVDPLVATKAAAKAGFHKRLADSWHARFV